MTERIMKMVCDDIKEGKAIKKNQRNNKRNSQKSRSII
jgi:hypothetical protein